MTNKEILAQLESIYRSMTECDTYQAATTVAYAGINALIAALKVDDDN